MGTECRLTVYAVDEASAVDACAAAFERIAAIEGVLSDYNPNSEAMRLMRREPGVWHPVSRDLASVLRLSMDVWEVSGGAFDPTVGRMTRVWREARWSGELDGLLEKISSLRDVIGFDAVEIDHVGNRVRFEKSGMSLDFGGIGKGYAADEALFVLRKRGIRRVLVDFGGDLVAGDPPVGAEGWSVVVRDGVGEERRLVIANEAVATSGDLEQFVESDGVRYSHILDPRVGEPLRDRRVATVLAIEGWLADALASAACVLGPDGARELEQMFVGARIDVQVGGD